MKNVIIILIMMLAFPLSNAAQNLVLIDSGTDEGNAAQEIQIYSAPYGADEGNLILKCRAEEIKSSKYKKSYFSILFKGETVAKSHDICKVGEISTLVLPAKNITGIWVGMPGTSPQDSHKTTWWIYY